MQNHSSRSAGSYARHESRRVECLDGIWQFHFVEQGPAGECPVLGEAGLMAVPQAFDVTPEFRNRRGIGVYRKIVVVSPGTRAFLEFESVGILATVYLDGIPAATNRCSYVPFEVELPASDSAHREVLILADNRFDEVQTPLHAANYDFRQYGGILGSVRLHHTEARWLKSLQLRSEDPLAGLMQAEVLISDLAPLRFAAEISVDGVVVQTVNLDFRDGRCSFPVKIPFPRPWSPQAPHLHLVRLFLPEINDDIQVHTGLRTIEAAGQQLWLNGEPLLLAGVNRHENHPGFGSAVPASQMHADLMILKNLGANFVRGSHYPQKTQLLDLCDELGILVWEEMLGWQQNEVQFTSEAYRAAHREALREMVLRHLNHPSVILWGFLNEAATDHPEARAILEESFEIVRLLDPSRPVTYATCKGADDRFLNLADVLCFNIYPGWYGCEEDDGDTLRHIDPAIKFLVRFARNQPGLQMRPILISEIGAEGIYGVRDDSAPFYSEDFQAAYIREVDRSLAGCPEISGIALWHFADIQTFSGGRNIKRPRGFNNKGLLSEYRQPKLASAAAAALFARFLGGKNQDTNRAAKPQTQAKESSRRRRSADRNPAVGVA